MAKPTTKKTLFALSFNLLSDVRLKTSGGIAQFHNPLTGEIMGNTEPSKWLALKAGCQVNLISFTENPDVAVVLVVEPALEKGGPDILPVTEGQFTFSQKDW